MKNNDRFPKLTHFATDELFRREREQTAMFQHALGPSFALQEQLNALKGPIARFAEMQNSKLFRDIERAGKMHADHFKFINQLVTPQWHSAVRDAATRLSLYDGGVTEQLRSLSTRFDADILATSKMLHGRDGLIASAIAAANWQDQWKSLADRISPSLAAFRIIAEQTLTLELVTLRASEQFDGNVAQYLAEQAVEAHKLAAELAVSDTPKESARIFIDFVGAFAAIFDHFKGNTIEELRRLGLINLLLIAMTVMSLPQLQPDAKMSSEEKQHYAKLQSEIASLKGKIQEFVETESLLSEAFISSLPRGKLNRPSNIRQAPERDAPRIMIAEPETAIAIIRSQGRWKEIVFRDPLTDQLSQGWVYGASVTKYD
jgi:hypothetical protein